MMVYDGACYVAAAIESVLAQQPRVGEIIVLDHGSARRHRYQYGDYARALHAAPQRRRAGPVTAG